MSDTQVKQLLDQQGCADLLRVTIRTLRNYRELPVDPIPCYRPGCKFLYDMEEVLAWSRRRMKRRRKRQG